MPILGWLLYADPGMAPYGRSSTTGNLISAVVPDGRFLVAENNSGRFDAWLKINYQKI